MDDKLVPQGEVSISVDADALPGPLRDALAPNVTSPPVERQRASHVNTAKLASEKVVISAPLSFAGSAARIWKLTGLSANPWARAGLGLLALTIISFAWVFVAAWYVVFSLFLIPYRLMRRGQRKRKREALQHRELLDAVTERER